MTTEKEKMLAGEMYAAMDPELVAAAVRSNQLPGTPPATTSAVNPLVEKLEYFVGMTDGGTCISVLGSAAGAVPASAAVRGPADPGCLTRKRLRGRRRR